MKNRIVAMVALLTLTVIPSLAQVADEVTLPLPISVVSYRVSSLQLRISPFCEVVVTLTPNAGTQDIRHGYGDKEACDLIASLNRGDFRTVSLQRRILDRLVQDGILPNAKVATKPQKETK